MKRCFHAGRAVPALGRPVARPPRALRVPVLRVPVLLWGIATWLALAPAAAQAQSTATVSGTVTLQGWQGTGEPTPQLTFTLIPTGSNPGAPLTATLTPTPTSPRRAARSPTRWRARPTAPTLWPSRGPSGSRRT